MKKLAILLTLIFPLFVFNSCDDDFEEITEVYLSAVLTPTSTSASVSTSDGYTVTFRWYNSNYATQYKLEIYQFDSETGPSKLADVTDDLLTASALVESLTVAAADGTSTTYVYEAEPDAYYYARVKAQNADDENQGDSGWAVFPYPIETYAVMDPIPSFEVTDRTSSSITVAWTLEEDDEEGLSVIRVSPDPTGASTYASYDATGATASDGVYSLVIDGLDASTMYTLKANYYSAVRYSITAWTRPATDGSWTTVTDTASFHQAITDGASKILVAYSDTPYYMGSMSVSTDLEVCGESLADGTQPTIVGNFAPAADVANIHVEDLTFDGSSFTGSAYNYNHLIGWSAAPTGRIESIEVVNCYLYHFKRGLLYFGTGQANTYGFGNILFDSVYCEDFSGDGGEAIGFRGTSGVNYCTIDNITIQNSTFTTGMREFIRVDASYPLTKVTIANNTFNELCTYSGSNGIFYFQNEIGEFNMTSNLFLNMTSTSCQSGSKYYIGNVLFNSGASTPNTVSSYNVNYNYWYNLYGSEWDESLSYSFFNSAFTQSIATSNGAILTEDPCYNSERGIFNVTSSTVSAAAAGDPRWLIDYVVPEDEDLVPVEYGYTWDLTDSGTFDDVVEATCVRGNIQFIVTSNPINMVDDGQEFTAAATFNSKGIPTDCALKFLVDQPGAVVLSAVSDGDINNHITVAYGPSDGSSITGVAGAAYAGASGVKASMQDIVEGEETAVYIYACGPIILSELSWTKGVSQLSTPSLSLSSSTAYTTDSDVTLSWDTVNGAGSYEVTCVGPAVADTTVTTVTGTSMTISPSKVGFGNLTYTVMAISGNTDDYTDSEVSDPITLAIRDEAVTLGTEKSYTWDATDFEFLAGVFGENAEVTESFAYNGLNYIASSSIKFGTDTDVLNAASEVGAYRCQLGGAGSTSKRALMLTVGGSGTLTVEANSSGSGPRYVMIQVGTAAADTLLTVGEKTDPGVSESIEITATSGTEIYLYSKSFGMNFFSITWTPSGASEGTTGTSYSIGASDIEGLLTDYEVNSNITTDLSVNGFTYGTNSGNGKWKINTGNLNSNGEAAYYIQFGGSGKIASYQNCMYFTADSPGILTVEASSSNATETRTINVYLDGTILDQTGTAGPTTENATVNTWDLSKENITSSVIAICSASSAMNVYSITWTATE